MKTLDTIRLRIAIGILGFALPWIVLAQCLIYDCVPGAHFFPNSISETYYYEPTITLFMGILIAAGIVLMCYKGYEPIDGLINSLTGMFALCICFFPTWGPDIDGLVGTFQLPMAASSAIHNFSAAAFFCLLSYNCLFLFTKSSGIVTKNKKIRNVIYRVCGIGMIISMISIISLGSIYGGTWFIEAIALMFFGIAYLTKADVFPFLFCDSKMEDKDTDNA